MDESCIVCDGLDGQLAKEGDTILYMGVQCTQCILVYINQSLKVDCAIHIDLSPWECWLHC